MKKVNVRTTSFQVFKESTIGGAPVKETTSK